MMRCEGEEFAPVRDNDMDWARRFWLPAVPLAKKENAE